jgi:hypothetical protein
MRSFVDYRLDVQYRIPEVDLVESAAGIDRLALVPGDRSGGEVLGDVDPGKPADDEFVRHFGVSVNFGIGFPHELILQRTGLSSDSKLNYGGQDPLKSPARLKRVGFS